MRYQQDQFVTRNPLGRLPVGTICFAPLRCRDCGALAEGELVVVGSFGPGHTQVNLTSMPLLDCFKAGHNIEVSMETLEEVPRGAV